MRYRILLAFFVLYSCLSNSWAQQYAGITTGINTTHFYHLQRDMHRNSFHLKTDVGVSGFYELADDKLPNLRCELGYYKQRANLDIEYQAGHGSYYRNLDYTFEQLNVNLMYCIKLYSKTRYNLNLLGGLALSTTLNEKSSGNGWDYRSMTYQDSSGNNQYTLNTYHWTRNVEKTHELGKFNFGIHIGLEVAVKLTDRISLLVQNSFTPYFMNASILRSQLHLGIKYSL